MKKVILIYLSLMLVAIVTLGLLLYYGKINVQSYLIQLSLYCSLVGLLGGITHCFRAFYLHICVLKNWETEWECWYFIRPIVSAIMGFISMLFVKAGLLAFSDTSPQTSANRTILYLAVAFLGGYNVQNFLKKLEEISKSILGIEKKMPPK